MGRKLVKAFFLTIIFIGMLSTIFRVWRVKANDTVYSKAELATTLPSDMPVVFVDPQNTTAGPGDTITISVKIFNLTNRGYLGNISLPNPETWAWGEPLPPPGGRYNYSLGNLYGFEIQFSWNTLVLDYVNHTVKVPADTYSEGILWNPVILANETLDDDAGTYMIAYASIGGPGGAPVFNCPDDNATVFEMTFNVIRIGKSHLNITWSDLAVAMLPGYNDFYPMIPHCVVNGQFQTEIILTGVESLKVEPFDNESIFEPPIISGESALVRATLVNYGNITDTYNLTLHLGTTLLETWLNETLDSGEQKTFNYTIDEAELSIGNYTTTANISVLHDGFILTDEVIKQFRVVGAPQLSIIGPSTGRPGDTVSYACLGNYTDPYGELWSYMWTLWGPGETHPRISIRGENATFDLDIRWPGGDWIIKLSVKDNYGVEHDENRPATASYLIEHPLFIISAIRIDYVSPPSGPPGTPVYINGRRASGEVRIYFDGKSVSNLTNGDWWATEFKVPDMPPGEYIITALDVATNTTDTAIFTMIQPPTLTISPSEAPMGSKISIFGEDFTPGMPVILTFEDLLSVSSAYYMVTAGENGTFNATMILPAVNSGNYTIKAISPYYFPSQTLAASVSFRVTKGLDTLFEELEALHEAINQTGCSDPCEEDDLSNTTGTSVNGEESNDESAQANLGSDIEGWAIKEASEFAKFIAFEARIIALIAIIIAIAASVFSAVILLKRS